MAMSVDVKAWTSMNAMSIIQAMSSLDDLNYECFEDIIEGDGQSQENRCEENKVME